jgi:hypothetical protein
MRSPFVHSICDDCWAAINPNRQPVRLVADLRTSETCCFCGERHLSGIVMRRDPGSVDLRCKGEHTQ